MKKVFSLLLALSMLITGSFGVMAQAQTIEPTNFDEINFQITSKENPDAYIESRFVPGNIRRTEIAVLLVEVPAQIEIEIIRRLHHRVIDRRSFNPY